MSREKRALHDRALRRAIAWITARLDEEPDVNRAILIDQASKEFGLTPVQEEFLLRQFGKPA